MVHASAEDDRYMHHHLCMVGWDAACAKIDPTICRLNPCVQSSYDATAVHSISKQTISGWLTPKIMQILV